MALTLHVRSGIVDAVLCVIIDIVLLYFISRLLSMLGFLLDLRKLRSRGRIRIKEIDFPVVGSMRRTVGGYFTFVSMVLVFVAILVVETGMNGSTVKRKGELFKFEEVRYLSINHFNNNERYGSPRFHNSGEARHCQSLEGDWKVQYAEFRGPGLDSGKRKNVCSNSTDTSIETLRVSGRTGRLAGRCICERRDNESYIGELSILDGFGIRRSRSVLSCNVKLEVEKPAVQEDIAEAKIWYFKHKVEVQAYAAMLLSYRNESDGENFYRVVGSIIQTKGNMTLSGQINATTFLVKEQYFDFTDEQDFAEVSNKTMRTSCKDVRCLLSKKRSGLSNFTIATWLLWRSSGDITGGQLGQNLDATFNEQFGEVRILESVKDSKEDRRLSHF